MGRTWSDAPRVKAPTLFNDRRAAPVGKVDGPSSKVVAKEVKNVDRKTNKAAEPTPKSRAAGVLRKK